MSLRYECTGTIVREDIIFVCSLLLCRWPLSLLIRCYYVPQLWNYEKKTASNVYRLNKAKQCRFNCLFSSISWVLSCSDNRQISIRVSRRSLLILNIQVAFPIFFLTWSFQMNYKLAFVIRCTYVLHCKE